jgi:putative transcriptional regulator
MVLTSFRSAALASIVLLAVGAGGEPAPSPAAESLAGQLLVAAPSMGDPRFYHTVILMVRDDPEGSMGIVINRPVGERPLAEILKAVGEDSKGVEGKIRVFAGGPVQPQLGFVLHSPDYHRPGTIAVDDHVALTADRQVLEDISHHKGPRKSLFAFGYAGWAAGQLAREMEHHDWFTAPDDPGLVFDLDRDRVWEEAVARRTREL